MPSLPRYSVHPDHPQPRPLQQAAALLRAGAVGLLPTSAGYLAACDLDDKAATEQLRLLGEAAGPPRHAAPLLLCRDVAQAASYLQIDNGAYRGIRDTALGDATFALQPTRRVPRRVAPSGRVALLRFAGHAASQGLLDLLDAALLTLLPAPGMATLEQMPAHWQGRIDFALDAGDLVLRHPALAALAAARGRSPAAALVD